eukprot:CAMPEP_0196584698 /NCGR_PEP_ID=MMETSP1081-20130531/48116_1 /TAXON_ID=36882 /ORGANISM="Pyramimonas amylifera, Strain CCMP720" /LENGTH=249 /DNA_ID=CAMNT_0041906001 /DNA_START=23 /DNA_END=769 /DNA_ORIENTATION=+
MKVKAVFFDLDDTLVLTSKHGERAWTEVGKLAKSKKPQLDEKALLEAYKKRFVATPWDITYKVEVTEWRSGMWSESLKEQNIDDLVLARELQGCFDEVRLSNFPFEKGTKEMLDKLHAQGIKTGIITNGHYKVQQDKIKACKAAEWFDIIINGGEEVIAGRKEKPDASIFLKACKIAGVSPNEAVHVGDSLSTDIQGGINAGVAATVFVSQTLAIPPPSGPQPTFTVRTAVETVECIEKMHGGKLDSQW